MIDIDIFIDLESLGIGSPLYRFGDGGNVNALLNKLPITLADEGYKPRRIWGTACVKRQRGRLPGTLQIALKNIFVHHGGFLVWTEEIADNALIKEAHRNLLEGRLAQNVLLFACDHDFRLLVKELVESGRFVIVSGSSVSKRLVNVASRTIPLGILSGEDPGVPVGEGRLLSNPVVLP